MFAVQLFYDPHKFHVNVVVVVVDEAQTLLRMFVIKKVAAS